MFANADILPAVALASLVFDKPGLIRDVCESVVYAPRPAAARAYDAIYPAFVTLYPAVDVVGRLRDGRLAGA